jgi:hypothetical protein
MKKLGFNDERGVAFIVEVILVGVVLAVATLAVLQAMQNKSGKSGGDQASQTASTGWLGGGQKAAQQGRGPASAGACADGPLFNHIPMAMGDFRAFRPLGFVTLPQHIFGAKHSNFSINMPGESKSGLRVEFPSDAVVTGITSTEGQHSRGYQMTFFPCNNFKSYFFHLGTISDKLKQEFKSDKAQCQNHGSGQDLIKKCEFKVEIKVKSGELAGTNDGFGGVDFGAVDYRLAADYANLKRYDGDYPHYTSPVLYFTPALRKQLESKLRSVDGKVPRTAEPKVGALMQDVKGTAAGNWFVGDKSFYNTQDFSPFLGLLHDYIDPGQPVFSMGTSVKGLKMGLYSFRPVGSGKVNRDFKDVKPDGSVYCYDNFLSGATAGGLNLTRLDGVIIMTMPEAAKLKVEKVGVAGGMCAGTVQVFSGAATVFDR